MRAKLGARDSPNMVAEKIVGYDPSSMNWTEIELKTQGKDSMPIENECLQAFVRLWQHKQRANVEAKGDAIAALWTSTVGNSLFARNLSRASAALPLRTKMESNWRP